MTDLLAAYDTHLRTAAEVRGATSVERLGPLWVARYEGGRLFVTYAELDDPAARVAEVAALIAADDSIVQAEWKTRSHDHAPGLEEALTRAGFVAEDSESVMLGDADTLVDVPTPAGVTVRQMMTPADLRAALDMQDEVFGGTPYAERLLPEILERQARGDGVEVWAAEVDGRLVSVGRIDPIPGTAFAGIWGGATRAEYRGRGIYRALTAARARSAISHGVRWIHSDSTEFSRPILERAGLVTVTTTVPWTWERSPAA
ncbi:GNAT family N-acetyltransferase [Microbacterium sp. ZW T5_56]|uniref:GNAT family N-acetyltransferase n=1 Tax=Microbacterium sp. ZW T5_56 TaxID=3378081 RepID=UPI0038527732